MSSTNKLKLVSDYQPTKYQNQAVDKLLTNYQTGKKHQVLLGVTGSGKTFVAANLIEKLQAPALFISHNKTLAGQLYQELKSFFPNNMVSYFVSYYDYYQPEAYLPSTDTYIEKDADINLLIDRLRLEATSNLASRKDVIVVASVSCIYNLGSPKEYQRFTIRIKKKDRLIFRELAEKLISMQYERTTFGNTRGTFKRIGENLFIHPSDNDNSIVIREKQGLVNKIQQINSLTGEEIKGDLDFVDIFPAKHYLIDPNDQKVALSEIRHDLDKQYQKFIKVGKILEAERIKRRVLYDLEMIEETGYVKGIENYSRHFDQRKPGEPPDCLIDFFNYFYKKNWLLFVDESHITFPQIRGMFQGDHERKKTLIEYGFRLPSALDNRPITFTEFESKIDNFVAISATPGNYEKEFSEKQNSTIELLTRPTGIPDPKVIIRPTTNQVSDVIAQIRKEVEKKGRVLVTVLTKAIAEDLASYLKNYEIKVTYLHSDIKTLERSDLLEKLRLGDFECLVGVNLLREGLDLPEVTLVAILDADKQGFLRSEVSLIQTMGRAARHIEGRVILYADHMTSALEAAIKEVKRRRKIQISINIKDGVVPKSIIKPVRQKIIEKEEKEQNDPFSQIDNQTLTPYDKKNLLKILKKEMGSAAKALDFELAAQIRDKIISLEQS